MVKSPWILALVLVTSRKINCYYPDIGSIRYLTKFNCIIQSRIPQISVEVIHILFSYEWGIKVLYCST